MSSKLLGCPSLTAKKMMKVMIRSWLFSDQISASAIARNGIFIKEKLEHILTCISLRGNQTKADVKAEEERARNLHEGLMVLPQMDELSDFKCDIDKLFNCISIRIDEESDDAKPNPPLAAAAAAPVHDRSNLKLSLPKFSGKVEDWPRFWGVFESRMKRETSFTDLEKIGLLEEAMEMTEAKEIVRQASQSQCYSKTVEALKREYDQPRLLFAHHINRLLHLRAVKDDNRSLGEFQCTVEGVVEGFQTAEGYTAD